MTTTITLRSVKGSPLTHQEVDDNFSNLKETADNALDAVAGIGGKANASAIGVDDSASNMGTYTGSTIPDNGTVKQNIQSLETAVEARAVAATLAASGGAALVGYTPADGGAVVTVQTALRARVYAKKDFHAVGDGVADDSTALRAGATYAAANNCDFVLEAGNYKAAAMAITSYTGNGCGIIGESATITLAANETGLTITDSLNVHVSGIKFKSAAISGASQIGIKVVNSGRIDLRCSYEALTYGEYWASSATGLATGAYPIPSRTMPTVKACAAGVYCAPTAEYIDIVSPNITDCTLYGILSDAGNVKTLGGTVSGNDIGIVYDGSNSSNGDHGAIVGVTVNHNAKANIYLHDLDYSMLVTGCQIWAAIATNFGAGALATSFGIYLANAKNVNITGNTIANSKVNLGHDGLTYSIIGQNTFIADSARTTHNIKAISALSITTKTPHNIFEGTLVAAANNNDPEQLYAPTLAGAWVNFNAATYKSAGYWRDANGVVHLQGVVKDGTIDTTIFTLPNGFRPATIVVIATVSNALFGYIQINTDGTVVPKVGNNAWVSLEGITFKAEN
jgi:hypothetical protein